MKSSQNTLKELFKLEEFQMSMFSAVFPFLFLSVLYTTTDIFKSYFEFLLVYLLFVVVMLLVSFFICFVIYFKPSS